MPEHADPVLTTARSYENSADQWREYAGTDRSGWQPSYDKFVQLVAPGGLVLDLGCGPGLDAPALAGAGLRVVGLDVSARLLQAARGQGALAGRVFLGDLRSLPLADGAFDGVWADGSLHHVTKADLRVALSETARVLRQGGAFMASVERGDGEGFRSGLDNIDGPRWYARYEPDEWRALLRRSGFIFVDALMGDASEHSPDDFIAMFARKL